MAVGAGEDKGARSWEDAGFPPFLWTPRKGKTFGNTMKEGTGGARPGTATRESKPTGAVDSGRPAPQSASGRTTACLAAIPVLTGRCDWSDVSYLQGTGTVCWVAHQKSQPTSQCDSGEVDATPNAPCCLCLAQSPPRTDARQSAEAAHCESHRHEDDGLRRRGSRRLLSPSVFALSSMLYAACLLCTCKNRE